VTIQSSFLIALYLASSLKGDSRDVPVLKYHAMET